MQEYIDDKVSASDPADKTDAFLSPDDGYIIEHLMQNVHPDESVGEMPVANTIKTLAFPSARFPYRKVLDKK